LSTIRDNDEISIDILNKILLEYNLDNSIIDNENIINELQILRIVNKNKEKNLEIKNTFAKAMQVSFFKIEEDRKD